MKKEVVVCYIASPFLLPLFLMKFVCGSGIGICMSDSSQFVHSAWRWWMLYTPREREGSSRRRKHGLNTKF